MRNCKDNFGFGKFPTEEELKLSWEQPNPQGEYTVKEQTVGFRTAAQARTEVAVKLVNAEDVTSNTTQA